MNACDIITGFGAKIELDIFTSNMQTMQAVPTLSTYRCIQTSYRQCYYRQYWHFKPTDPACLYETNICARICNCTNQRIGVPQYSGFVRWVQNLDYDMLFPPVPLTFDHPIRFAVVDFKQKCPCQ